MEHFLEGRGRIAGPQIPWEEDPDVQAALPVQNGCVFCPYLLPFLWLDSPQLLC